MRLVLGAAILLVLLIGGAFAFVFSGFYNVAATRPHTDFVWWLLDTAKQRSVELRARNIRVPRLDDPALVARGAGQFQLVCFPCHGAPGIAPEQMGAGLNPVAPDLARAAPRWNDAELFWIVDNGIKFTGMPGWRPTHREDEIWALVAFVRRLPQLSPAEYQQLVYLPRRRPESGEVVALRGGADPRAAPCASCHDLDGSGGGEVPALRGQHARYLLDSLRRYAAGTRPSGIMEPIARGLSENETRAVVDYYAAHAGLGAASAPPTPAPALLQHGGVISAIGAPERGIAACASCHGAAGRSEQSEVPILAGQHRLYLALQLRLWKSGVRSDEPMREIARRLRDEEIEAVSAYFSQLAGRP
jgi:cytochrome c553